MGYINPVDWEIRVSVLVNGELRDFIVDTGSQATIITEQSFRGIPAKLEKTDLRLVSADGSPLGILGKCYIILSNKGMHIKCMALVVRGARRNLIGIVESIRLKMIVVVNSITKCEFDPFQTFPSIFQGLGTLPYIFKITLREGTKPYRINAPRPIAHGLRDKAHAEIKRMLSLDVIEPVESPTDWCFGLTIAPKANGSIRMCVDLTTLNRGVKREYYPLPRISDLLSQLSQGRIFSKLDANSGFWQILLDHESKPLTTFLTPWGRFQFKRLPFGITSAPEFWQRSMEKILGDSKGVICMMDDVLIYGKDPTEHWERVYQVLDKIHKSGMTLKKEKCEFGLTEVKFLGHIVSAEGIKLDPSKVSAICTMEPPTCQREAKRFMGMVNYLNKFSSKLAGLCIPIYDVTGSKSDWYWGSDQQSAFESIKLELSMAPVLCAFDSSRKHRVSSDASRKALGAVLLQLNCNNDWQPVEYASRKLTDPELNYAMIELEALGITWACEKFDYYLVGRIFEIETDHKPLISLLGEKDLSQLPIRVQRFKMRLMRYSFEIFHTPGSCMYIADFLSRPNGLNPNDRDIAACNSIELHVAACMEELFEHSVQEQELLLAMKDDPVSIQLLDYIRNEWPSVSSLEPELKRIFPSRDHLSTYGDIILFDSRLYIPECMRHKYLTLCHEGHQGTPKCQRRARQLFWWPNCSKDIEDFVSSCEPCIKQSKTKHQPMEETELPSGRWVELGSDTLVFNEQNFLLVVDYYTKWIEVRFLPSLTSHAVITEFKSIFATFGVCQILRSDNAGCYASQQFRDFASTWGFIQRFSSPRYPQSNGLAERSVGTVKGLLKKCNDLSSALLAYRSTPLSEGYSPAELMFSKPIRTPLGQPKDIFVDFEHYERVCSEKRAQQREKWNHKYHAKYLSELLPGQRVWVKSPTDKGAEGIVLYKDQNPHSYWVKVGESHVRRNRKHLFLLNDRFDDDSVFVDDSTDITPLSLLSWQSDMAPSGKSGAELISHANVDSNAMLSSASQQSSAKCSKPGTASNQSNGDSQTSILPVTAVPVAPLVSVGDSGVSGMSNPNRSGASNTPNRGAKVATPNRASNIPVPNRVLGSSPGTNTVANRGRRSSSFSCGESRPLSSPLVPLPKSSYGRAIKPTKKADYEYNI